LERVAIASGDRDIEQSAPEGFMGRRILRGTAIASRGEALLLGLPGGGTIITPYDRNAV
jgi:hypothetical protein